MNIVLFVMFTLLRPDGAHLDNEQKIGPFKSFAECQIQEDAIRANFKTIRNIKVEFIGCVEGEVKGKPTKTRRNGDISYT